MADAIPSSIRFGTSSWSFPGWAGIVYESGQTETSLARGGLRQYVRHPLLRTVGIDRSYYRPLSATDLAQYAEQLPAGFPCCAKVPATYTTRVHLGHGSGPRGSPNPVFLDPSRFTDEVAASILEVFRDHMGPLILEFPPMPRGYRIAPAAFVEQLERFLTSIPRELPMAVEVRDERLLTPEYARMLARCGAAHVYNYWSAMPPLADQENVVPLSTARFVVVRLLLRPGTRYDERKNAFAPFDRILDRDEPMRAQVWSLLRSCVIDERAAFVLVNNKAEGSAPLTIEALATGLVERLGAQQQRAVRSS